MQISENDRIMHKNHILLTINCLRFKYTSTVDKIWSTPECFIANAKYTFQTEHTQIIAHNNLEYLTTFCHGCAYITGTRLTYHVTYQVRPQSAAPAPENKWGYKARRTD